MSIEESNFRVMRTHAPVGATMNGSPYMVMPGARIGIENGKLVESLGQSHLAGITGPPTYGIGTGIGTQAMAGCQCATGATDKPDALKGMLALFAVIALGAVIVPRALK